MSHSHESGMDSGNAMNGHTLTFSQWPAYQLRLLFQSWDITEPWQFALTWYVLVSLFSMKIFYNLIIWFVTYSHIGLLLP